jgi:iron complex outermembrane receptor protein
MPGPFELGVTAKRTGPRFVYDTNEPVRAFVGDPGVDTVVFPASTPAYWLVNLDARLSLADYGPRAHPPPVQRLQPVRRILRRWVRRRTQPAVTRANSGTITNFGGPPFVQIGAPRTISATLTVGF